ncbi:tetratricopeptide repeat protein [uncultured Campylobacter sp.]|uniref:tetratricopeptide repeat protein n=1 Tax=uncultured Campylobacter sp. TaxID=218934 RepID=UPI002604E75C|nr:tetratricopeptide repeat protein [uncultured Campylobacter sp.]
MKRAISQTISHVIIFTLVAAFASGCTAQKKATPAPPKPVTQAEVKHICDGKTPKECNDMGVKFENSKDYERAKLCYQKACDDNEGIACSNLGSLHQKLKSKEESEILKIFMKSCKLGNKYGCYNAANFYRLRRGTEHDFAAARKLYEKSCLELNHAQSCSNLGGMYQFSLGVKTADSKTAKKFYKMGCEMGDEIGCRNLSLVGGE